MLCKMDVSFGLKEAGTISTEADITLCPFLSVRHGRENRQL